MPGFDDPQSVACGGNANLIAAGVIILFAARMAAQDVAPNGTDFEMTAKRGNDDSGGERSHARRLGWGRASCQIGYTCGDRKFWKSESSIAMSAKVECAACLCNP
jgi:hypothetical protein